FVPGFSNLFRISNLQSIHQHRVPDRHLCQNKRMAKRKSVYTCRECGASFPKWSGQCPDCRAWNAMEEGVAEPRASARGPKGRGNWSGTASASVSNLAEVRAEA